VDQLHTRMARSLHCCQRWGNVLLQVPARHWLWLQRISQYTPSQY
jgi:hypothetical protein